MSVSTVTKDQFKQFVSSLIGSGQKVVGVQAKNDKFAFGDLKNADDLRLDYDVTILSPRKYILPPKETLLSFEVGGKSQSVEPAFGAESLWARAQPPPVRCTLCWAFLNFNEHLVLLALFSIVN